MEETDPKEAKSSDSTLDMLGECHNTLARTQEVVAIGDKTDRPKVVASPKPNLRHLRELVTTRHMSIDHDGAPSATRQADDIDSTTSLTRNLSRWKSGKMRIALQKLSVAMIGREDCYRNVSRLEQLLDSAEFAGLSRSASTESNIVRINVSGLVFETTLETLEAKPNSLLGDINKRNRYYLPDRDELFFDRCRRSFVEILSYYQTDEIKRPEGVCLATFVQEMHFFQLDYCVIQKLLVQEKAISVSNERTEPPNDKKKHSIWKLLSVPESSPCALAIYLVRLAIYLYLLVSYLLTDEITGTLGPKFLEISEIIVNAVILADFLARLATCPDVKHFMRSFFTIVDLTGFVMLIITIVLGQLSLQLNGQQRAALGAVMKTLQMFRVLQLFRYSRSDVTKALTIALRNSVMEIMSIFLVVIILSFCFGSMLLLIEGNGSAANSTNTVKTLGDAIWLAIVTMTTVGYGDLYPVTWAGRAVITVCVCFGQVVISMIIPIVSNLYQEYYNGRLMENKLVGTLYKQIQHKQINAEGSSSGGTDNLEGSS